MVSGRDALPRVRKRLNPSFGLNHRDLSKRAFCRRAGARPYRLPLGPFALFDQFPETGACFELLIFGHRQLRPE
jgi:hypothetical protein